MRCYKTAHDHDIETFRTVSTIDPPSPPPGFGPSADPVCRFGYFQQMSKIRLVRPAGCCFFAFFHPKRHE
ncbi:hypothetical protein HanRHA438_Chr08g0335061 [Helianthus annuus]|nr:hypothetical protein HanRHA438_Chr08g0335061 [Helianthus annuus]